MKNVFTLFMMLVLANMVFSNYDDTKKMGTDPLMYSNVPYVVKQAFTNEEIKRIHAMPAIAKDKYNAHSMRREFGVVYDDKMKSAKLTGKGIGESLVDDFEGRGHRVIYIQDALRDFAPKLFDKIYDVANVNLIRWTKKPQEVNLGIKRIEYIKYQAGKEGKVGDWIGWHHDIDVRLTMSLMLVNNSEFVGGIFQAKIPETEDFPLSYRDCVLFPGHIVRHRVTPITKGTRYVLIVEFWDKKMQSINRSYEQWYEHPLDVQDPIEIIKYCIYLLIYIATKKQYKKFLLFHFYIFLELFLFAGSLSYILNFYINQHFMLLCEFVSLIFDVVIFKVFCLFSYFYRKTKHSSDHCSVMKPALYNDGATIVHQSIDYFV